MQWKNYLSTELTQPLANAATMDAILGSAGGGAARLAI